MERILSAIERWTGRSVRSAPARYGQSTKLGPINTVIHRRPHHLVSFNTLSAHSILIPILILSPPTSMSSALQATSSTSSTPNVQLISNALADYAKKTGIDLSNNPFAVQIERARSPAAILELLQERANAFKHYREGNRRLITFLTPAVNVIQALTGTSSEAVGLVSSICHPITLLM